MERVEIGNTGISVSRIGLGTSAVAGWDRGPGAQRQEIEAIQSALDRGVNLVDTAPLYGFGRAEELLGTALRGVRRHDVIIATKAGLDWSGAGVVRNSSRERLLQELDDSLHRLGVDYIDIYQIHWPDRQIPIEETAATLLELYNEGRIRAIGVSNYSVEQMERFRSAAPLHTVQPPHNLFERESEAEVLPYCRATGLTAITYGSLCRGLLSGRLRLDSSFEEGDLRRQDPKFQPPRLGAYLAAVQRLDRYAYDRFGKTVIDLALRWTLDHGSDVALWGVREPAQLAPLERIWDWQLDEQAMSDIDAILAETVTDPAPGDPGPEER